MITNFSTTRFAVIGIGDSGISIIRYLIYKGAPIIAVCDTRADAPNKEVAQSLLNHDTAVHYGKLSAKHLVNVDVIVLSPGVSIYDETLMQLQELGKRIIGDIELFAQELQAWQTKVIAITGSNGKTTVTSLTGHLARALGFNTMVCGNIGTPVLASYLEVMQGIKTVPELVVLELSSFQLETTYNLLSDAATVLNISEDHLDRYRDLLQYAYVKSNIFTHTKAQILNSNDVIVMAMRRITPTLKQHFFGHAAPRSTKRTTSNDPQFNLRKTASGAYALYVYNKKVLDCNALKLIGIHNYLNCLASLALIRAIGIDILAEDRLLVIKRALIGFSGVEHRLQKLPELLAHKGVLFIDDSKGTNVGATIAGVAGLNMPVHLILGGDGKGQDFAPLRQLVINCCKTVAIIGQDKINIANVLAGLEQDYAIHITLADTLEQAIQTCISYAKAGEAIVLSPACASWDMFDNYKHRAQVFIDYVNNLS